MSFYPCRGGGNINLDNAEEKKFVDFLDNSLKSRITLEKNYQFVRIITSNDTANSDNVYVYVSLNNVKQNGTYFQNTTGNTLATKVVTLKNLKKGDVIEVRGMGYGIFIK